MTRKEEERKRGRKIGKSLGRKLLYHSYTYTIQHIMKIDKFVSFSCFCYPTRHALSSESVNHS